jgi:uncharacterized protein with PIN domain
MKIIKKNNKIICNLCKSELEFEPDDIKVTEGTRIVGKKFIICPVCKSENYLRERFDKPEEEK